MCVSQDSRDLLHLVPEWDQDATDHSFTLGEDGSLVIHTAEMGHAGVYELEVANELGVDRHRVSLGVYGSEIELPGDYQMTVPAVPLSKFGSYIAKSHENNKGDESLIHASCLQWRVSRTSREATSMHCTLL